MVFQQKRLKKRKEQRKEMKGETKEWKIQLKLTKPAATTPSFKVLTSIVESTDLSQRNSLSEEKPHAPMRTFRLSAKKVKRREVLHV